MEEEMEIEQMKIDLKKKNYEMRDKIVKSEDGVAIVKFPKLASTKFEGSPLTRFNFGTNLKPKLIRKI